MDAPDPVVEVRQGGQAPVRLSIRETLVVGRECEGLEIRDPQVSRRHLSLEGAAEAWAAVHTTAWT
ncbi:MAG: hypothetical protein JO086_04290 [Acidimicrobiia bacterium]|nr:hypothetical protein [Acidimicrobiia bacterium]